MSKPVLKLQNVCKSFRQGAATLDILKSISFTIEPGETVALIGPSGSGKSTLLQIAGLLDVPDSGEIHLLDNACHNASDAQQTAWRGQHIGFVYQYHHLLPECTAEENVMMPQLLQKTSPQDARAKAHTLLDQLGLKDRATHRPSELSGGEQQRVALARAMANNPALILADEPTGNLDPATSDQVFSLLVKTLKASSSAALIATHDHALAKKMDRILELPKLQGK